MRFILLLTVFIRFNAALNAQYPYLEAPEKWSTPKEVTVFRENNISVDHPCVSADGNSIFSDGIRFTFKADSGWSNPVRLSEHISRNMARKPCISPNGRSLFFTWWVGGWQLYYCDWDDNIGDWSVPVNCGQTINNELGGPYAENMPNDSTIILTYGSVTYISIWDNDQKIWQYPTPFAVEYFSLTTMFGTWVSPSFDRVYGSSIIIDTTRDGESFTNYYFDIVYRDSTNPALYAPPYVLNICFESDSLYFAGDYEGRHEAWPTLTADGKTMYFIADYHEYRTLYESHMIIDENGDSVKTEIKPPDPDSSKTEIPGTFVLKTPYPNPFNSRVTIEYELPSDDHINLSIYDLSGRLVAVIRESTLAAGYYSEIFNGRSKASGIYFIDLKTQRYGRQFRKIVLVK